MNSKGRPTIDKNDNCEHQQRPNKAQPIKQYWTQHRLTLLAYEAQYMYAKQPIEIQQEKQQQVQPKKKGSRKKVNLQYQSSFLSIAPYQSQQINVDQLIRSYDSLHWLFTEKQDENFMPVRQFVKILLQLKHSAIVKEFCEIYNIVVRQLKSIQFSQLQKQEPRFQLLEGIKQKILNYIEKYKQKFSYFTNYLKNDELETKKLILVEAYCLLAQKFNFNINQFYSEAFTVSFQGRPTKKVKKSQ